MEKLLDTDIPPKGTEDYNYLIYCACGCGKPKWKYDKKGNAKHYLPHHDKKLGVTGRKSKRDRAIKKDGYIYVLVRIKGTKKRTYAREHRIVMENILGRKLKKWEVIHHIDEDKTNNDPNNLHLCTGNREKARAEHDQITRRIHTLKRKTGLDKLTDSMYRACLKRDAYLKVLFSYI